MSSYLYRTNRALSPGAMGLAYESDMFSVQYLVPLPLRTLFQCILIVGIDALWIPVFPLSTRGLSQVVMRRWVTWAPFGMKRCWIHCSKLMPSFPLKPWKDLPNSISVDPHHRDLMIGPAW